MDTRNPKESLVRCQPLERNRIFDGEGNKLITRGVVGEREMDHRSSHSLDELIAEVASPYHYSVRMWSFASRAGPFSSCNQLQFIIKENAHFLRSRGKSKK
ncbi:hypothetical protein EVAR_14107_1 [Eumeta japonica]|uniref:Uncharacterized protein n=1 Tax=Eumeta variegata TaxID=151549 RepID=A0A4C1UPM9_EUMVA|nr:hypothetical protein EVAR_14107_1 [Eumeta japonica]